MALNYFRAANGAHKKRNIAIILVALLLLSSVAGIVAAKYVSNYHYEAVIHASNFHFSSNYLNSDNTIPSFNVSDWGSNNITFYLYKLILIFFIFIYYKIR